MLKKILITLVLPTIIAQPIYAETAQTEGKVAVANRADGTVSIIDVSSDSVIKTLEFQGGNNPAEPMYVNYKENRLYVGDRANDRVVVFDSFGFNQIAEIPIGQGVFHMWPAKFSQDLAVANDIDNTITLIDTNNLQQKHILDIPERLVEKGFKPHDVFLSSYGDRVFVSLVDGKPSNDYILQFNLTENHYWRRHEPVITREVGGDPHLFIANSWPGLLYVASQESGTVGVYDPYRLQKILTKRVPNAHGIFLHDYTLYVTNIADNGDNGLISMVGNKLQYKRAVDTPYATPHNISVTDNGEKIYITHSGADQNKVTVYSKHTYQIEPTFIKDITVGLNPFGLAYIPH